MHRSMLVVASLFTAGMLAACDHPSPKLTQQDVAIANATTAAMAAPDAAVAQSRYRTYRWMTPEEMLRYKVPYDPTMADGTRYTIQQAVDTNLTGKGFQQGQPADFVIALSDVYLDNNRQAAGFGVMGEEFTFSVDSQGEQSGAYQDQEQIRPAGDRLTFLFLDARTHRVLWAGRGNDVLVGVQQVNPNDTADEYLTPPGPQQSGANIDAAVYQALATMPVPLPSPQ